MPKPKPWLKLWIEWIDDDKIDGLSLAGQGSWWRLVAFAGKIKAHEHGRLVKASGQPYSINEICRALKINTKADRKIFNNMIEYMIAEKSLHWDGDVLVITNFPKRQSRAPSDSKEAVRHRVAEYRRRQKGEEKKESPPDPLFKERDIQSTEDRKGPNSVTFPLHFPLHVTGETLHLEPVVAEIAKLYEENIGPLSSLLGDKFGTFSDNYHSPIEWIKDAFAEAAAQRVLKWAYIEKILLTWQEEGRQTHESRRKAGAPSDQRGPVKDGRLASGEPTPERYREGFNRRKR